MTSHVFSQQFFDTLSQILAKPLNSIYQFAHPNSTIGNDTWVLCMRQLGGRHSLSILSSHTQILSNMRSGPRTHMAPKQTFNFLELLWCKSSVGKPRMVTIWFCSVSDFDFVFALGALGAQPSGDPGGEHRYCGQVRAHALSGRARQRSPVGA